MEKNKASDRQNPEKIKAMHSSVLQVLLDLYYGGEIVIFNNFITQ